MGHDVGSFDYRAINSDIVTVLDTRSLIDNTVQIAMPFLKATTTIQIPEYLGEGNIGFTLGLHSIGQDVQYEDMYSGVGDNKTNPLIGYTYDALGDPKLIYAKPPSSDAALIASLFDKNVNLVNTSDFVKIAPPGITKMTIGRNKNGLLAHGQVHFSVPSLAQLEILHRTFLIPGCGMVLEWGQQFAPDVLNQTERVKIEDYMFPWHDRDKLMALLHRLQKKQVGLQEILTNYVYPTNGQYMWMFGRVGNFTTKANGDGSFECVVKIVGPSEEGWAYSVYNTVIPPRDASKTFCSSDSNSIAQYFRTTSAGASLSFKSLLDNVYNNKNDPWHGHVAFIEKGNKKEGDPKTTDQNPNASEIGFDDAEDSYFMTWRFFVNVVLNDPNRGALGVFVNGKLDENELSKIALLRPYANGTQRSINSVASDTYINDPMEQYVGMNKYLRSIDPSTMIIVNEYASNTAEQDATYNRPGAKEEFFKKTNLSAKFLAQGDFALSITESEKTEPTCEVFDKGFLSSGVWLNHKAIIQCMLGADTIMRGIVNLLERMNRASMGYWQLTIDPSEPIEGIVAPHNYTVMDVNYRASSDIAVSQFFEKVHVFNKYVRKNTAGDLVGSDLIDCDVDLSLPKLMFSQIATMGLVHPEDLKHVGVDSKADMGETPLLSDPNDSLRKMFSITSLSPSAAVGSNGELQGPDLTIAPKPDRSKLVLQSNCGQGNAQVTMQAGGIGNTSGTITIAAVKNATTEDQLNTLKAESEKKLKSTECMACQSPATPPATVKQNTSVIKGGKKLSELTVQEIQSVQKPNGPVLAVGKYQAIPATFKAWLSSVKLPPDTVFSSSTQEQLGTWLLTSKRPLVGKYVNGDPSVTVEQAQLALAQEFASLPVPGTPTSKTGYYDGIGNNRASVTSGELQQALIRARSEKSVDSLKAFIAKGEGNYDSINRGSAGDTALYSTSYFAALNTLLPTPSVNPPEAPKVTTPTTAVCTECDAYREQLRQVNIRLENDFKLTNEQQRIMREFPGFNSIFRYIEVVPDVMISKIRSTSDGSQSNAFGAAPASLSISADLTLPGINGFRVGELFWIDRMPAFYKAFGAFQIISIEEELSKDGWMTKIHSRFNYLGNKWKDAVSRLLVSKTGASK